MCVKSVLNYVQYLALMSCFCATSAFAQADLVIGVRADAPPFSYLHAPRLEDRLTEDAPSDVVGEVFTGYMINICTAVLTEMRKVETFSVRFEEVEAKDRFLALKTGAVNVLCDPATINRERLADPTVFVSPPVYLSGVGRAQSIDRQWVAHWPCIGPVVGIVEGTTAARSVKMIADSFGFGETFSPIVQTHPNPDNVVLSKDETKT